jgi:hypothetical protein
MTVAHGNRGFCNINNEAIMIEYLRKKFGLKRVAVVDTDVHHGDGSQEIFWHDPDVLFISFHQDGRTLYPGSGFIEELGGPLAHGTTINVPLPPGTTDTGIHYALDNLIMPLLEDFKPEIVVNSAGQDNHFTDPLANRRFSARGYASLNQKLAPDICVLEGGYSVETALPYVNMGILMAMAGIDYSNLKEPDYYPGRFKEPDKNMDYIRRLVNTQLHNYRTREEHVADNRKKHGSVYTNYERIFYDTDYIHEEQSQRLKLCQHCHGYRTIDSSAQHRNGHLYRVFCVSIPIYACSSCQAEGRQAYQDMLNKGSAYDYIYLQDKADDVYRRLNTSNGIEQVL